MNHFMFVKKKKLDEFRTVTVGIFLQNSLYRIENHFNKSA